MMFERRKTPSNNGELQSVKESLEHLYQIFFTTASGMRVIDTDFNVVQMNKSFCRMSGNTIKYGLTRKCYEMFENRLCHSSECPMPQIVRGKKKIEYLVEKKNKKGHCLKFMMTATPLKNIYGGLDGIVEHFTDLNHCKHNMESSGGDNNNHADEELTSSFKTLLQESSQYRNEIEDSILFNIRRGVTPCLEKLKRTRLSEAQKDLVDSLELHLDDITSPFVKRLSSKLIGLTPAEIEVARLVKMGKTNDEIADTLFLSKNTILSHRFHIRTKLKLKSKKINLRTYLHTLEE